MSVTTDTTPSPGTQSDTPTPSGSASPASAALVTALQAALADEHAAIYGYGVLAVRLAGAKRDAATTAYETHRVRRGLLTSMIVAAQAQPAPAAPAYELPSPVATAADATQLAALLEERLGATYADIVRVSDGDSRRTALEWLTDSAVRAVRWRGTSVAFPGLPERDGSNA